MRCLRDSLLPTSATLSVAQRKYISQKQGRCCSVFSLPVHRVRDCERSSSEAFHGAVDKVLFSTCREHLASLRQ